MKVFYFLLLAIFFTSFQNFQAQTKNSVITIKKKNETYLVSGIVKNEFIKDQLIETIKKTGSANVNAAEVKIDNDVSLPDDNWKENLEKQLAKIKNSKTAFFQIRSTPQDIFPKMSDGILNAEILLTQNNEKVTLNKYENDIIILTLVAHWAVPAQNEASVLNQIYDENLKNVRIIAVNIDAKGYEDSQFLKFVEKSKIKFQTGWANKKFIDNLIKVSKFNGVPQTFIIENGRLRGIFVGGGDKVNEKLIETARKISEGN